MGLADYLFELYYFMIATGERLLYIFFLVISILIILYLVSSLLKNKFLNSGFAKYQLSSKTSVWICCLYIFCSFIIILMTGLPKDLPHIVGKLEHIEPPCIWIYESEISNPTGHQSWFQIQMK